MVKYFLFLLLPLFMVSCGKKDDSGPKPDQIDVTCATLRNQDPSQCETLNVGETGSSNEICRMGFGGTSGVAGRVLPRPIQQYVASGQIKLYNTVTGKYMKLTPIVIPPPTTSDRPNFFILQHVDDSGNTSTVTGTLPACSAS
jgi:hypothetical protein